MEQSYQLDDIVTVIDIVLRVAVVVVGALWALYKIREYREFKRLIQLDLDAHLYKLNHAVATSAYSWDRKGKRVSLPKREHTHAVEMLLKFNNKGKTRLKLFNIQVGVNTLPSDEKVRFDEDDAHLQLTRIFTSGNLVPKFAVEGRPVEETSFYYIEPGVEQTIHYLALITEPRELVQIYAKFSLEQKRIFPQQDVGAQRLYPHTVVRTYQLSSDGHLIGAS